MRNESHPTAFVQLTSVLENKISSVSLLWAGWLTLVLDFWHCHSFIAGYFCLQEHDDFSPWTRLFLSAKTKPERSLWIPQHVASFTEETNGLSALTSWFCDAPSLMHSIHRKHQEVVCLLGRASSCVEATLGNPKRICVYIFKGTFTKLHGHITNNIINKTKQNETKQKKSFPLADLCGPLLQWFPITVGDPVPTHNPLLGVQFRSFCFVSARFFHTCFCAAVFPSAGGTTLLAVVHMCFRNLCWAPAICQTHTLMVVGAGVYSGNGGVWIQSKTVEKVQLMLSQKNIGPHCQHILKCVNSAVCESGAIWQHVTNCLKWSCEDHRVFKLLALLSGLNFIYQVMYF